MFALFAPISQFLARRGAGRVNASVARNLFEKAGARSGSNPRQARELRSAALAYLRVVR